MASVRTDKATTRDFFAFGYFRERIAGLILLGVWAMFLALPVAAQRHIPGVDMDGQGQPESPPEPVGPVLGPTGDDVLNVLLLGSDTANPVNAGRTDVIMVVSINRTQNTVNLLSIPRDLYVYIPDMAMQRINTVYGLGENNGYDGGGYGLLRETLLYNLGLVVDHYARVDFNDFQALVDALGGIELTVPCALQDWQLISPDLDPAVEENWHLVTLEVGVQRLDGYEALWYARSRRTSSDIDRGRRQQDIIRAIWRKVNTLGLINQVPALWGGLREIVHTDMTLPDLLGLIPTALAIEREDLAHFRFELERHVRSWRTPNGESVLVPQPVEVALLMEHFMQPVTENRWGETAPRVEILNATGYAGMDQVAADLLSWEGFAAFAAGAVPSGYQPVTAVYDYAPSQKGHRLNQLLEALRLGDRTDVVIAPSADRTTDFRVILGGDYRSCHFNVMAPVPTEVP